MKPADRWAWILAGSLFLAGCLLLAVGVALALADDHRRMLCETCGSDGECEFYCGELEP